MKKTLIYLIFLPLLFQFYEVKAQVTIGSGSAPKYFSILEVDAANTKGGAKASSDSAIGQGYDFNIGQYYYCTGIDNI